jgi:hypothetical protein
MKATDEKKALARQIGAALRSRSSEIARLLPDPWDTEGPLTLDKQEVEKFGDAFLRGEISAEYDEPIALDWDVDEPDPEMGFKGRSFEVGIHRATADFVIGCNIFDDDMIGCEILVDSFDPDDRDKGVEMKPKLPAGGYISIESYWKKRRKPFDPSKDLWPLVKKAMKKLQTKMPNYVEMDADYGKSETERVFGSEAGYWRWKEGR